MPVPSNENYVASKLIGNGSRSIEARLAAIEGILQYGPQDPEYFPDIEARKLSVFAYDENGNPGYLSLNRITNFVPLALQLSAPPVGGDLVYGVAGTVSYENGGGVNYAIPGSFPRIPNYNGKDAFSTTGSIIPDINDAVDLPYAQGYFDGVNYRLDLKTNEGISRFFAIDPSPESGIQDAIAWTGYGAETNPNTIVITAPQATTVADPGQFIEDTTDLNSSYIRGWQRIHHFPEIDQYGFLKVSGIIPRAVSSSQLNNIPRIGEVIILPDFGNCICVGNGINTVLELDWKGEVHMTVNLAYANANRVGSILSIPYKAQNVRVSITQDISSVVTTINLTSRRVCIFCEASQANDFAIRSHYVYQQCYSGGSGEEVGIVEGYPHLKSQGHFFIGEIYQRLDPPSGTYCGMLSGNVEYLEQV